MTCTDIASGTRASLSYTEEPTCGVSPTALNTASATVDSVESDKTGAGVGELDFVRTVGSWIDDGYAVGDWVLSAGFSTGANNGYWKVLTVIALTLTVDDTAALGVDEVAAAGQTVSEVGAAVDSVAMDKSGAASGQTDITRASGSFIDDGFLKDQWVKTAGFTTAANNGNWKVATVTALTLSVYDPDTLGVDEVTSVNKIAAITMATLRATGRQLNLQQDTLESEEVRPSRQFSDVRMGFNQVVGDPGFELSNESYSDFIRGAMSGEWEQPVYGADDLGITVDMPSAGFATLDRATGNWETEGFRPGDIITTTGFTNAVNNRQWRIITTSALDLVVDSTGVVVITEAAAAGPLAAFPGYRIDIGLSLRTFTMERLFTDIEEYQPFRGVTVNEMGISITPEAIVGGTWGLLGMSSAAMVATSLINPNDPIAAPTTAPFAAFDGRIYENGISIAVATSLEISLTNNRTLEGVIGSKFSPGVFEGRAGIDGTAVLFLRNNTTYNKFVNETESSMWVRLDDPNDATQFMNIVMPRLKWTTGDIDPPLEGPVPLSMGFRSLEKDVPNAAGTLIPTSLTIQSNPIR